MTRVTWREPSGEVEIPGKGRARERFAQNAFAGTIGKRVPFRSSPGGPQVGWATVIDVQVDDDGHGAVWTADTGDLAQPAGPVSFSFRDAITEAAALAHDPLAVKPLVIRERGHE